jgi:hypothetical protein
MYKFKALLISLLISISSFSQTSFSKAYKFYIGVKETKSSSITWDKNPIDVDILITISTDKVKIYSSETQVYHIVSEGEKSDNYAKYLAVDGDGNQCFYFIGYDKEYDVLYQMIEYADYAWMYLVIPN